MESDRELLELAAKAAGIIGHWERDTAYRQERYYFNVPYDCQNMLSGFEWNPLQSDAESLRLAVKLNIRLVHFKDTIVPSRAVAWESGPAQCSLWEPEGNDPYAATRRAIVRAAAEIGKTLG